MKSFKTSVLKFKNLKNSITIRWHPEIWWNITIRIFLTVFFSPFGNIIVKENVVWFVKVTQVFAIKHSIAGNRYFKDYSVRLKMQMGEYSRLGMIIIVLREWELINNYLKNKVQILTSHLIKCIYFNIHYSSVIKYRILAIY